MTRRLVFRGGWYQASGRLTGVDLDHGNRPSERERAHNKMHDQPHQPYAKDTPGKINMGLVMSRKGKRIGVAYVTPRGEGAATSLRQRIGRKN